MEDYAIFKEGVPNAGQFGYSANDMKSVTDLMKWVEEAQRAATSASNSEQMVINTQVLIDEKIAEVDAALVEANEIRANTNAELVLAREILEESKNNYTEILTVKQDVITAKTAFDQDYLLFRTEYNEFTNKYDDFLVKYQHLIDSGVIEPEPTPPGP